MIAENEVGVLEEWRSIPGAEGYYSVSSLGRVRSERSGRILKCCQDTKGYLFFRMSMPNPPRKKLKVHRAVAMAFLGEPREGDQVNHKNGVKTDNRVDNLEYVSCRENIRHCWKTGLHGIDHCQGEANPNTTLTADEVVSIRQQYPRCSYSQLARVYKVTKQTIANIVKRRTWAHV